MEKLFRLIDVSVITTVISGLLYVIGYKYFLYFYSYFGINLLVRDPEIAFIFTKGFDFGGYLLVIIAISITTYIATYKIVIHFFKIILEQQVKAISLGLSLLVFTFSFTTLLNYVQEVAEYGATKFYQSRQERKAKITFQDGTQLLGLYSFFFMNKSNVVLFNTNTSNNTKPPLTIIPSNNVLYIDVN